MDLDFTIEEFNQLISEMGNSEKANNMLCKIVEKIIKNRVHRLCCRNKILNDLDEMEIINTILIRIWQSYVTHFFRNSRVPEGEINNDPEGFQAWVITVARNEFNRFLMKRIRQIQREIPLITEIWYWEDDEKEREHKDVEKVEIENHRKEEADNDTAMVLQPHIKKIFECVIDSAKRPYMILSWLSVNIFILDMKMSRINATNQTVMKYKDESLSVMWDDILSIIKTYEWLEITEERIDKINADLKRKAGNGDTFGNFLFKSFFGKKDGNAVVSDWFYRINNYIRDRIKNETFDD